MGSRDALSFPPSDRHWLEPYLPAAKTPQIDNSGEQCRPHVTLTYATSLDSALAIAPGRQTALSGSQSKAMTHHLRSRHDAILVGVNTAVVDDPSLNCRLEGVGGYGGEGLDGQPRPVVIDPSCRWAIEDSKLLKLARQGRGRAPIIFCTEAPSEERGAALISAGGSYAQIEHMSWAVMLERLCSEYAIRSIMIEGGRRVINDLLTPTQQGVIDAVIITIAPTWLGMDGVKVEPARHDEQDGKTPVGRLRQTLWHQLGDDVVLCGRMS